MYKFLFAIGLFTIFLSASKIGVVYGLDVNNGDGFLSMRTKPKGKEIGRLHNGDELEILVKKGGWYKVKRVATGDVGWAFGKWIRVEEDDEVTSTALDEMSPKSSKKRVLKSKKMILHNTKQDILVSIDAIDEIEKYKDLKGIGFVKFISVTDYFATDYGPNKSLFLIFHNKFAMPHRYASFKVGSFGRVDSVRAISDRKFEIKGDLFVLKKNRKVVLKIERSVVITVDISDLVNKEVEYRVKALDYEGAILATITLNIK